MFPFAALGSLLGGVGSLASAFMGGRSGGTDWGATQAQWNREDTALQRRVADGAAAGLNPLAAIGASSVTSPPVTAASIEGPANMGETGHYIGNALKELAESPQVKRQEAMKERMDDISLRQAEADLELTRARSRSVIAAASHPTRGLDAPVGVEPAGVLNPKVTEIRMGGVTQPTDKGWSDAQDVSNRYGDWVGGAYGTGLFSRDALGAAGADKTYKDLTRISDRAYDWFRRNFKGYDDVLLKRFPGGQ